MTDAQTILVADDSPNIRQLVRSVLQRGGYRVIEAATGPSALRLASQHRPDAVILDFEMPLITGANVCERIRRSLALAGTRIVMLTGSALDVDQEGTIRASVDAFIMKPFSPRELLATVQELLPEPAAVLPNRPDPRESGAAEPAAIFP
jgi:CheY-like chemotaxis protein